MKILVMGLPGSGKTTFAKRLAKAINAIHFDADVVRKQFWPELGFTIEDRIIQARRMGQLCDIVDSSFHAAIADFVCPTPSTRIAFAYDKPVDVVYWMDTIKISRFEDTNKLFVLPLQFEIHNHIKSFEDAEVLLKKVSFGTSI